MQKYFLFLFFSFSLFASPFNYDLHLTRFPGTNRRVMVCFHGMGGNWRIGEVIKRTAFIDHTIVSFNFPDHDFKEGTRHPSETFFGTIHELLPPLYVLKTLIVDEGIETIDLYGFSAGGGAVVNMLFVLNTMDYDNSLAFIGLDQKGKEKILEVLQKGTIILDTPLKSVDEIIAYRGSSRDLLFVGERYHKNGFEPLHSIEKLKKLFLQVIVHFQNPDHILSNRDDWLYIKKLREVNQGMTLSIIGYDSGHSLPHPTLWQYYHQYARKDAPLVWKRFDSIKSEALFRCS